MNYNGWRDTLRCLESLLRSHHAPLHIIVCDNGSSDGSVARIREWAAGRLAATPPESAVLSSLVAPPVPKPIPLRECTPDTLPPSHFPGVTIVACGRNLGFAGANNIGLRYVLGEGGADGGAYAFMLNNDAVVAPGTVSSMVAMSRRNAGAGAIGATILEYDRPDCVQMLGGARFSRWTGMTRTVGAAQSRNAPRPAVPTCDYLSGACMLVPRATLERVGLMDERYFLYGEDVDWGIRIRKNHFDILYCPDAEVWHRGGGSIVHRSPLHDYYDVRGRLMLVQKHFPAALPAALLHSAVRSVLPKLVRGEWTRLRAALRAYRDFARFALTGSTTALPA